MGVNQGNYFIQHRKSLKKQPFQVLVATFHSPEGPFKELYGKSKQAFRRNRNVRSYDEVLFFERIFSWWWIALSIFSLNISEVNGLIIY